MKKGSRRNSISLKIILTIVLFLILAMTVMEQFLAFALKREVRENMSELMLEQTHSISELIQMQLDMVNLQNKLESRNPEVVKFLQGEDSTVSNAYFKACMENIGYIENILLVDRDGIVQSAGLEESVGQSLDSSPIYDSLINKGNISFTADPSVSPSTGHPVITLSHVVKDQGGQAIGFILTGLDLQMFSEDFVRTKNFSETGYTFLMTSQGIIISHPDSSVIMEDLKEEEFFLKGKELVQSPAGEGFIEYVFNGAERVGVVTQLKDQSWMVIMTIEKRDFYSVAGIIRLYLKIISVIIIIVLWGAISLLINRILRKRLQQLQALISTASTGNLTIRTDLQGNDELTGMQEEMNCFLGSLSILISGITDKVESLGNTGSLLDSVSDKTVRSVKQINNTLDSTNITIQNQAANVSETSAAVEQMTKNISALNISIQQQSSSIEVSSASIEEIIANIDSISHQTDTAQENLNCLQDVSDTGKKKIETVLSTVNKIISSSSELQEANTIIDNIASQTNLLAINAAIEAAHAGEAGKGFAVVADEIRKLAEESSSNSKKISVNLKEISQTIDEMAASTKEADLSFQEVLGQLKSVDTAFMGISMAMKEQKSGSKEILQALQAMKDITLSVQTGSFEMTAGNNQILEAIGTLNCLTSEVLNSIHRINQETGNITGGMDEIRELSGTNKGNIEEISEAAEKFTI